MSTRSRIAGPGVLLLVLALVSFATALPGQTPATRLLTQARTQLDELRPDTAASLLRLVVNPGFGAGIADRLRGYVLLGVAELQLGRLPQATQAFREALGISPELRVDSLAALHPEVVTVFAAERAQMQRVRALSLATEVPADTVVPAEGGGYRVTVLPNTRAWITVSVTSAGGLTPLYRDSQLVSEPATFTWNLRAAEGTLVQSGRYTLRFMARDTAGTIAPPVSRTLEVERMQTDTFPLPAELRPADLAPESTYTRQRRLAPLLRGAALGAGASLLAGFGPQPSGGSDGRAYVVGGAIGLGALVGYVRGAVIAERDTASVALNQRRVAENAQMRDALARANTTARAQATVHIRTVGGQ